MQYEMGTAMKMKWELLSIGLYKDYMSYGLN